ncbi:MAG: hypothetical protein HN509_11725 [Halobacteriovoraceae bacterium]|jgi:hypothetical protein|nr:hypothetical protein [Halobacteriovoraceae bacterium]MBT5093594.1 hypothetical protein [Halobacteriovoraceae bacterium]
MPQFFHLTHDAYSRDVSEFLGELLPVALNQVEQFESFIVSAKGGDLFFFSPTPQNHEQRYFKWAQENGVTCIILLDHCHFAHRDFEKYTDQKLALFSVKQYPSLHGEMTVKKFSNLAPVQNRDTLFCSQPLFEDGRECDQFEILQYLLEHYPLGDNTLWIKQHPREQREVPAKLFNNKLKLFEGSMDQAFQTFNNWVGVSSMALYSAQALGKKVTTIDPYSKKLNLLNVESSEICSKEIQLKEGLLTFLQEIGLGKLD